MSGLAYFWGDDIHALERAADAVGATIAGGPDTPLGRWRTTGDATTPADIAERVATAPLFGGGTLVTVADPAPLLRSKADRDALVAVLGQVAPGNGLVFLESVDGSGRRAAALDALKTAVASAGGETREFKAPKEGQMAAWIEREAVARGMRLAPGAARRLAERIGAFVREGDVDRRRQGLLAAAEIDKLALYRPDAAVTSEDVDALVAEAVPGSTWALLDAVADRNAPRAVEILDRLLETTPEPVLLVHLHRRIRELLEVAALLEEGMTPQGVMRTLKLKEFRARKLTEQARRWTPDQLEGALEGLLDVDAAVKGVDGTSEAGRRLAFTLWVAERVSRARLGNRQPQP
jgi:DNA polymerase-3 subunit delta